MNLVRLCLILLSITALIAQSSNTNLITTLAGTDPSFGAGIDALATPLPPSPWGKSAADSAGNIYFFLTSQHTVFRLTPAGSLELFAGNSFAKFSGDGGPAAQASLKDGYTPSGTPVAAPFSATNSVSPSTRRATSS